MMSFASMVDVLAQAATEPSWIAQVLSVGGPWSGVIVALGLLAKLWLDSRRDKREDTASDRQSESGIVETTSAVLVMIRSQMTEMEKDMAVLRARLQERDTTIEKLEGQLREQSAELAVLRADIKKVRGNDEPLGLG